MLKFNYASGRLLTENESYDLDDLREYLLTHAKEICAKSFIGIFFRDGVQVEDSICFIDGKRYMKREVHLTGAQVNTYDWDTIFFKASKTNLIQNFINDRSRDRSCSIEAIAV